MPLCEPPLPSNMKLEDKNSLPSSLVPNIGIPFGSSSHERSFISFNSSSASYCAPLARAPSSTTALVPLTCEPQPLATQTKYTRPVPTSDLQTKGTTGRPSHPLLIETSSLARRCTHAVHLQCRTPCHTGEGLRPLS